MVLYNTPLSAPPVGYLRSHQLLMVLRESYKIREYPLFRLSSAYAAFVVKSRINTPLMKSEINAPLIKISEVNTPSLPSVLYTTLYNGLFALLQYNWRKTAELVKDIDSLLLHHHELLLLFLFLLP